MTKKLLDHGIYAGSPAKFLRKITPLSPKEKIEKTKRIISDYLEIAKYHDLNPTIVIDYPVVSVDNHFFVNFETLEHWGTENTVTDDFRDYIRKWGIRIFTERPMKSNFSFN